MDEVAENSDELMERYLEGEEISHEEIVTTLKKGVTEAHLFPVTCGIATKNLGADRLLEALVEDLPSPEMRGGVRALDDDGEETSIEPDHDGELVAYVFKTRADPFTGRINMVRVYSGVLKSDSQASQRHDGAEGAHRPARHAARQGDGARGRARARVTSAPSRSSRRPTPATCSPPRTPTSRFPPLDLPAPVMAFAYEPKTKGDEEKAINAVRRLEEEDPTLDVHRDPADRRADHRRADPDPRRGDQGPDEGALRRRDRAARRRRCPTSRRSASPPRRTPATRSRPAAAASSPTATSRSHRPRSGPGFEFENAIKGGVIPTSFIPAVEKGIVEAMEHGVIAGYPIKDVHVTLFDGQHHSRGLLGDGVQDLRLDGLQAGDREADPVLLEPIMQMTISVPEDAVGDVIGDLNSRRGRPLGMEPKGAMTEVKAEVPMAEILDYAPDLRAITGGRGDYTMEFERYEEVPGHLSQKVIDAAKADDEATSAPDGTPAAVATVAARWPI